MSATVGISAKRVKLRKIAEELLAQVNDPSRETIALTIEGEVNSSEGSWINVELSSDDMERDDIPDDTVYVKIDTRM